MTLKHAIIGCGRVAPAHGDAFQRIPSVVIEAAVDIDRARAEAFAAQFGARSAAVDYDQALTIPGLTSVSLAVPHDLHAPMALAAIEAGKHVLVEKPFSLETAEGMRVLSAAERANVVVMPVTQHRFDPITRIVKDVVASGDLGTLALVRGHLECVRPLPYYVDSDWRGTLRREGGSVLINQAYHVMDLLLWLAGPIARVSAEMDAVALKQFIETEDTLTASLRFANGALGSLSITGAAGEHWASFIEISGTAGVIAFDIDSPNHVRRLELKDRSRQSSYERRIEAAQKESAEPGAALAYYGNTHRDQARAFVSAIQGNSTGGAATALEAIQTVEAIQRVYASARDSRPASFSAPLTPPAGVNRISTVEENVKRADEETVPDWWQEVTESDIEAVSQVLRSGILFSVSGGILDKFERAFAAFAGASHGVGFANGTGAIHAALFAAGIQAGDDVLVCDYSFHGAAAAALRLGARIVPVDCLPDSLTMDPDDLKRALTPKCKAVLVHNPWGVPAEFQAIRAAAGDLPIVSDASHAHGATFGRVPIARWADITCFSLGAGKLITGGELGAAVTDSSVYRDRMLIYGHVNRVPKDLLGDSWKGNAVGLKLRPHVLAMTLALAQLKRYGLKMRLTNATCRRIERELEPEGLTPQAAPVAAQRVYWRIVNRVDRGRLPCAGAEITGELQKAGIPAEENEYWPLLQRHALLSWPDYRAQLLARPCPAANAVTPDTVRLPAPVTMPEAELSGLLALAKRTLRGMQAGSIASSAVR